MKRYLLLLFYAISSMAMQSPDFTNQFIAAIREADVQKVKNLLDAHPSLQKSIREYYNFTAEPIVKFAMNNPELKPRYMQIARYLVDCGALIQEKLLEQLKAYEASQKPASKPAASLKPLLTPITKPASPTPAAPAPKQVITSSSKLIPADLNELKELSYGKFNELKAYLETHDVSNLTSKQKNEIIEKQVNLLATLGGGTPELVHALRRSIKLLERNGFKMANHVIDTYNRTQKGDFGPRAAEIETLLNSAIKAKNLNRIKQLVEQEDADVNAIGNAIINLSPLAHAAQANAEDIAKYLSSKGAKLNNHEHRFMPQLQKWGIPVP